MKHGVSEEFPRSGQMQYWSQYQRKATLVSVITGGEYFCWMLWGNLSKESSWSSCRSWLEVCCLSHNVGLGRPEDVLT